MKNIQIQFCSAAMLFLLACKSYTPDKTKISTPDTSLQTTEEHTVPDTLRMRPERQVIFFLPGDEEINKMTEADKEGQVIETISDFIYYSSMVCDSLSASGVLCSPVTSSIIMTQDTSENAFLFDRKEAQHITGMIVYDGTAKPEVNYGVADYNEWMGIIKKKLNLQ